MARRAPKTETFDIDGPVGVLEAVLDRPTPEARGVAVVCHPHPQHGGALTNKVAHTLARAFNRVGIPALRFNFRGVGRSAGEYGHGAGEQEDTLAAVRHASALYPGAPIHLAGFSFGAAMAAHVATRVEPAALITVAPSVERLGQSFTAPACPWLIVHGAEDELVSLADVTAWHAQFAPDARLDVIDEASHFFHGRLTVLADAVVEFLEEVRQGGAAQGAEGVD